MEFKNSHLLMLCCTAFLAMAGGALIAPVLPDMVGPLHTTNAEVALLMSVYTISTAIFTLVIGLFIDRVNRKSILVACLIIYGLAGLVSFFVSDLQLLLILRFIQGIGVGGMMTLTLLIVGDVYRGTDSVQAISKISIAIAIGAISAPLIGGAIAMLGWNYPFLFCALSLPLALAAWALLPETREPRSDAHTGNPKGLVEALTAFKDVRIFYTVFMGFAIYFLLFAMVIYVPFMLKNLFGFTSGQSGFMLAIEGLAVVLLASRVRSLTTKFSLIPVIIAGFVLVGLSLAVMSFVPSIAAILLMLVLFGAGYGLAQTTIDVLIVQISPSHSRGGILSIHNSMKYVGESLAPVVLGIVLVYSGLNTVLMISGVIGLIIALMTYVMHKQFSSVSAQPVEG